MVIETALLLSLLSAPQVTSGVLTLDAEPAAQVVWEGVALGKTDIRGRMVIRNIPPGEYEIEVSKEGFAPLRKQVRVEGAPDSVEFRLEPLTAALPQQAPAPTAGETQPVSLETPLRENSPPTPQPVSLATPGSDSAAAAPRFRAAEPLSQAAAFEQKSSQVGSRQVLGRPLFWYLLVGALMAGVLGLLWRWQHSTAGVPPDRFLDRELFKPADEAPSQTAASASFLDDLRRREAMAEQGLHTTPRDEMNSAIDLDENDVRSVED